MAEIDPEVAHLDANDEVPSRGELADGADVVRAAIVSLDGGVNGSNPYLQLAIAPNVDGTIDYSLVDRETGQVQRFVVTITPAE